MAAQQPPLAGSGDLSRSNDVEASEASHDSVDPERMGTAHGRAELDYRAGRPRRGNDFDLFLSYASRDRHLTLDGKLIDVVTALKKELEKHRHPVTGLQFRVCTDHEDFELTGQTRDAIARMLDRSGALLVLCSQGASESEYVQFELQYFVAKSPQSPIIAAQLAARPSELFPQFFGSDFLGADLKPRAESAVEWFKQLRSEGHKIIARAWGLAVAQVHDRFEARRLRIRRTIMAAVAGALAIVGATAYWGVSELGGRLQSESLAAQRRYASDLARIQRAYSDGDIGIARDTLLAYRKADGREDLRTFEWFTYWRVCFAEAYSTDEPGTDLVDVAGSLRAGVIAISTRGEPTRLVRLNGQGSFSLPGPTGARLQLSPDGETLLAIQGSNIHVSRLNGSGHTSFRTGHRSAITSITMATQRPLMAAVDQLGQIELWDYVSATRLVSSSRPANTIRHLAFASNDRSLIEISSYGVVQILNSDTLRTTHRHRRDEARTATVIASSGDSVYFLVDEHVFILNPFTGAEASTPTLERNLKTLAASSDGRIIAAGTQSGDIRVSVQAAPSRWRDGGVFKRHRGLVSKTAFIGDDGTILSASLAGDVKVWDFAGLGRRVFAPHTAGIHSVAINPDDLTAISVDRERVIKVWSLVTGRDVWSRELPSDARWLSLSNRGELFVAGWDSTIRVLDAATGVEKSSWEGFGPLALSADGRVIAWVGQGTGEIQIRDRTSSRTMQVNVPISSDRFDPNVTALAFSPDGATLAIGATDGKLHLYDLGRGALTRDLAGHDKDQAIRSIAFSPRGDYLASGAQDATIRLWPLKEDSPARTLNGHTSSVYSLVFTPDSKVLASGSRDRLVKLWNVHSAQETATFYGHARDAGEGVPSLAFSRRGDFLLSAGSGGIAIAWQTASAADVEANTTGPGQWRRRP